MASVIRSVALRRPAFAHGLCAAAASALLALLAAAAAPAAAQRFEQGLLWRVESQGVPPSHVFGTVHVEDPRLARLPPAAARALEQARSLAVELGLTPANLQALAASMVLQDGRDLPAIAGAELFARAAAAAAGIGLPEPVLRLFKPWAVALLLMAPRQNPENVLDYVLVRLAVERGLPVHELESVDEQIAVFDGMAEPDQVALLGRAVREHERLPRTLGRIVAAYLARDLAAMWRIGQEDAGEDAQARRLNEVFVQRVLEARNARLAERIEARLKEGGAFIAVGALHLYGERGVLALLERRGWRVMRVY
ncbi:MAG TPA: TraB/GumN family protein [Burkholderiales bacterium]|nr:TraB/GumN family protein [Burkholderiales bacterium]